MPCARAPASRSWWTPLTCHRTRQCILTIQRLRTAALPTDLEEAVLDWLRVDSETKSRATIQRLAEEEDVKELSRLLQQRLEFGTAGLRGTMGPGYSQMNPVTVQQTAQGLCRYLETTIPERLSEGGVVIGYDGRHRSREFALVAAAVFASAGVRVHLFSELVPTPFVAVGVGLLGAAAGLMITASHNPPAYNGIKVYWQNACQIIPPHDAGIAAAIQANLDLWPIDPAAVAAGSHHLVSDPLQTVSDTYYDRLEQHLHFRSASANADAPRVAYTALHGVGTPWVQRAFATFGLPPPILTEQQCSPDPAFSTVPFPNPEEGEGAWQLAFEAAEAAGAVLAMATDPDADRFAVAERSGRSGKWRTFTGNEIGVILAHWVMTQYLKRHPDDSEERLAMLSTAVSSRMLEQVAKQEGFCWQETLTGFKWLGNKAIELEQRGYTVLFAFEEAIGYMFGQIEKDKDGVAAAAVFAELAGEVYQRGGTLREHLRDLQELFGVFESRQSYFIAEPAGRSAAVFERLRVCYPASVAGMQVVGIRDLGAGIDTSQPDGRPVLPWSPEELMITFTLEGPAVLTLRASGTEPKLKYYLEVSCGSREDCKRRADLLEEAVVQELVRPLDHGLRLRGE